MTRKALEVVVHERPLQQVETVGTLAVIALETSKDAARQENVAVEAQDRLSSSFAKNEVAGRGRADDVRIEDVTSAHRLFDEGPGRLATEVVDDHQLNPFHVLVEPEGLHGEVNAVEVAISRHSDGQVHGRSLERSSPPCERRE